MYRLTKIIENDGNPSYVPEISFHPDGSIFGVTFEGDNELRIFDARSLALRRRYRNPTACFDGVHGVMFTENHIIVSNSHNLERPSQLNVYRQDSDSDAPVATFDTPVPGLVEAHCLALDGDRLVVTYCEGWGRTGGLVCYRFDDDTGVISGPVDSQEQCFARLGDPKGLSFLPGGAQVLVSFNSHRSLSPPEYLAFRLQRLWHEVGDSTPRQLSRRFLERLPSRRRPPLPLLHNGLLVFDIGPDGRFSEAPVRVMIRETYCRLENANCVDDICAVSDSVAHRVYLYDLSSDPLLQAPLQVIDEALSFPHGARLSPDKSLLVVSNFGLNMWKDQVMWGSWATPRQDHIAIFQRC